MARILAPVYQTQALNVWFGLHLYQRLGAAAKTLAVQSPLVCIGMTFDVIEVSLILKLLAVHFWSNGNWEESERVIVTANVVPGVAIVSITIRLLLTLDIGREDLTRHTVEMADIGSAMTVATLDHDTALTIEALGVTA